MSEEQVTVWAVQRVEDGLWHDGMGWWVPLHLAVFGATEDDAWAAYDRGLRHMGRGGVVMRQLRIECRVRERLREVSGVDDE